jgi:pyruvate kinase
MTTITPDPIATGTQARRTKIVATLGPASSSEEALRALLTAGVDVVRLNFSHGTQDEHGARIELVWRLAHEMGRPIAVLQDLQGAKVRLGRLPGGEVRLVDGDEITLVPEELGSTTTNGLRIPVTLATLARQVAPGSRLLLADGRIALRALSAAGDELRVQVESGGLVRDHAGLNLPGVRLVVEPITAKDRADMAFGAAQEVDYVAMSFVGSARDVRLFRQELVALGSRARVIAKIEKWEALEQLEGIVVEADAVMVARGDLGVELPAEEVPLLQKLIIRTALAQGKAVITATQMLESMTASPVFTRAEASDVANAVLDGTAAVMLSEETAMGQYPVEAVRAMDSIARRAERDPAGRRAVARPAGYGTVDACVWRVGPSPGSAETTRAVSYAACALAEELGAAIILTPTQSGATAREVSRYRPAMPIVAVATNPMVLRQLALEWGVLPLAGYPTRETEGTIQGAVDAARRHGLLGADDLAVVTAGTPNRPGSTQLIRVVWGGEK